MQAVQDLDYVVNANARSLNTTSGLVAMVVNDITSPFFMNVASGVEEQAVADGRVCLVCSTQGVPERELSVIDLMRQRGAEAVILVGGMAETEEHLAQLTAAAEGLERAGSRLVLCARPWKGGAKAPVDVVECDMESGAFAATSHLLSAGHTRVAHLAGPARVQRRGPAPRRVRTRPARARRQARPGARRRERHDPRVRLRGGVPSADRHRRHRDLLRE